MKKSLVAVSVIVVLGAAWTGASWYTGKLIEQRMGEVVENANSQLKAYLPKAGVKLGYENYQRGIFSSKIRYVLRADGSITTDDAPLKPGDEVAFQETIDHGPFPFAQLKKFNLLPSMASVHTELENTAATKGLFDITKGKSLFTAESRISYSGDTSSAIDVIPLDYQKDKSALKFSGATINADVSRDMKAITLDANSDSAVISGPNQFGQTEQVQLLG
ncbi:MAG: YdgA family protein, partial [Serratia liquefaciens]|nr:YdgA family protein [Serratia liquefaciens]